MKCYYYLSPTLADTEHIAEDLHRSGVDDWFIHIVSKDEEGLSRQHLHSSNYLETMDFMRTGLMGAGIGFIAGWIMAGLFAVTAPFGPETPLSAYLAVVFLFTCFGAWQGGLVGISRENKKIQPFHDAIQDGKYLILVYANRDEEEKVRSMMEKLHPEADLVGYDAQFYNPFAEPVIPRYQQSRR